jgi:hypothetical protein
MFVLMEGTIRRRRFSGFGPFKRTNWDVEDFMWRFAHHGDTQEATGINLRRQDLGDKVLINGTVNEIPIYLADFDYNEPCKPIDFSLLSIGGIQIHGKATLVGTVSVPVQASQAYVA